MQQFSLGTTGLSVSAYSLGCLNFGSRTDKETSFRLLDRYAEAGGNFLDTANNYAFWNEGCFGGESESLLGEWIRVRKNRSGIIVATKVGAKPTVPGGGFDQIEGLSGKAIEKAIDESLLRLGTDYVDLLYAHIDDTNTPLEETLETFDRLIKAGKVRALGCSNYPFSRLLEAKEISTTKGLASYSCIQQRYTYLQPRINADFGIQVSADDNLLAYCKENDDFTMLAFSPLLGGLYSREDASIPDGYRSEEQLSRLQAIRKVARELGATPNQVVLAWMLQNVPKVLPLVAVSDLAQLEENLGALHIQLDAELLEHLNR
ncbi:aldo/keto reductase [Paenibacillus sp. PR3]|uniref:Aldo/keto reductase n=1 Tax=Paenibacillus terricola TaxID=2763503 RepID=A0ABR8N1N6_9BACL|nr:aldo/keto reductase [Paenibacillus terricola]MBD3922093.1 aldo/keto reductase [Paenibacillus terricola]